VNEFGSDIERHRRQLLMHCYRNAGLSPRTPRTRCGRRALRRAVSHNVKERAPLRPWLCRAARNGCLESRSVVWFPASSETFQ
jgi:hypothetical protein